MTSYLIVLQNEAGQPLDGEVEFISDGAPLGGAGLHQGGTRVTPDDIPAGTNKFKFTSPGYGWFSTSNLYETNVITLVKEVEPAKYILIGGVLIGGMWVLSRFIKL